MKFIIIVEGETEKLAIKDFLKRWLDNNLSERVGIKQRLFIRGKIAPELKKQTSMHFENDQTNEIIGIIGLMDLYGFGDSQQGIAKGASKFFKEQKKSIESHVDHSGFRMFFAVHEFEAWLLSNPEIFPRDMRNEISKYSSNPEGVNFKNHPSKVIQDIYRRKSKRNYMKTTDGPNLFGRLDPETVYEKCPYFKMMLDEMLQMAVKSGISLKH